MSFDEYLFGKFVQYLKNKKPDDAVLQRTVELESIQQKLTLIARAMTGRAIEVFPAVKEGGYKGDNFFLPSRFNFYENSDQNLAFYLFRTLYLCQQQKMQLNWFESTDIQAEKAVELGKINAQAILAGLIEEFPAVYEIYEELATSKNPESTESIDTVWLYGHVMKDSLENSKNNKDAYNDNSLNGLENPDPKTILKARAVEEIKNLTIDKKQQEDYVLTHNFEKVETADEFSGTWRDFDGDDDLEEHSEALEELVMKYTVRSNEMTHSVYQADFTDNANIAESAETSTNKPCILYDEWDCYKNQYRRDFAKVYPDFHVATDEKYYTDTIKKHQTLLVQLRKILANISNRRIEQRYQTYGKEIDIDMATDRFVDVVSGQTPSERVYIADKKMEKDLSILILLDISLSSDGYTDGNRVIDVAKQTAILFGEILNEYHVDFSIQCFYSQTRNNLSYITVKDFDDKWQQAKHKIGSIRPTGYTRIGGALRHSGALLHKRDNKNKWVILLSDGKPNDYDRYEGKYGVSDVKQALRELNQNHVNSYVLAIESTAKYYLPQMFGQNHYQIVSSPNELIHSMIQLYDKLRVG
ncbi:MAG: VWA domain-containing protein [Crocinitomicaceae bacterium]|nr:VWA domain-containing protein [Crocinitomicaceae bacterium]